MLAPHGDALLVGLQDGDRDDAARPEVGVQVGQVGDPADVRRLIQRHHQRRVQPPAEPLGAAFGGPHRGVGQRRDHGAAADRDLDSRYKVSRLAANSTGSKTGSRPRRGGVTQAMISGSVIAFAAVRAVW